MIPLSTRLAELRQDLDSGDGAQHFPSAPLPGVFSDGNPVRIAIADLNHPQLLIPVSLGVSQINLPKSSSLEIKIVQYKDESGKSTAYVQVRCMIIELENVFLDVAENICRRIAEGGAPADCVGAAIEEFRELLREKTAVVDRNKVLGLFGELLVIKTLMARRTDVTDFWTGPFDGRRDFSFPQAALEVKTSERTQQRVVTIHSLDQLEVKGGELLYLWYLCVEEDSGSGRSVPDLVRDIESVLPDRSRFEAGLEKIGYKGEVSEGWNKWKWGVLESTPFQVVPEFPRIISDSFACGPPLGISHITYRINLDQAEPYRILESDLLNIITL